MVDISNNEETLNKSTAPEAKTTPTTAATSETKPSEPATTKETPVVETKPVVEASKPATEETKPVETTKVVEIPKPVETVTVTVSEPVAKATTVEEINAKLAAAKTTEAVKPVEPTPAKEVSTATPKITEEPAKPLNIDAEPKPVITPVKPTEPITSTKVEPTASPVKSAEAVTADAASGSIVSVSTPATSDVLSKLNTVFTGVAKTEASALKQAAGFNASSQVPANHTSVVNPKTGLSHNAFSWFYVHVVQPATSVLKFTSTKLTEVNTIVKDGVTMSPAFIAALKPLITDAIALATSTSLAVSEGGVNPLQDVNTLHLVEQIVNDVHVLLPIIEKDAAVIEAQVK